MINTDYYQPHATPDRKLDDVCAALRLRLSLAIKKAIEARGLTHANAALIARTPRTSLIAIANGNLERVSMDRLVAIAHRLGVAISLRLAAPSSV